jgi:hypothetical protein
LVFCACLDYVARYLKHSGYLLLLTGFFLSLLARGCPAASRAKPAWLAGWLDQAHAQDQA